MKLLAKFTGKVVTFNKPPTPSLVLLTGDGKTCEATAPSDLLQAQGVDYTGAEFEILINEGPSGVPVPTINKIVHVVAPAPEPSDDFNI
jgi:hypothetical protein